MKNWVEEGFMLWYREGIGWSSSAGCWNEGGLGGMLPERGMVI